MWSLPKRHALGMQLLYFAITPSAHALHPLQCTKKRRPKMLMLDPRASFPTLQGASAVPGSLSPSPVYTLASASHCACVLPQSCQASPLPSSLLQGLPGLACIWCLLWPSCSGGSNEVVAAAAGGRPEEERARGRGTPFLGDHQPTHTPL